MMKRETEENKTLHSLLLDVLFVFLDGYVLPDCMDLTTNEWLVNQVPASPQPRVGGKQQQLYYQKTYI